MKRVILIIFLMCALLCVCLPCRYVYAESGEQDLDKTTFEQLDNIDFNELDKVIDDIQLEYSPYSELSFKDRVKGVLNGEYFNDYNSLFEAILNLFLMEVKQAIPIVLIILCIAILSSIANSFVSSKSSGVGGIVHFACYGLVITLIATTISKVCMITTSTLSGMQSQMDVLFPILLTMLTAVGGQASVGILSPVLTVLSNAVSVVFAKVLYPMFILNFVFIVLNNLSDTIKLNKFNNFLKSAFKWIVGIIFTLFSGLLAVQGIVAGRSDGVGIKLTKFTIKSYIPIVGGYISDGMDMIVLSSMLIKNAVGLVGLIVLLLSILSPIIYIVVVKLLLKFTAGIIEPLGSSKLSSFIDECSDILVYPIAIIMVVAIMYIITLSLFIGVANVV